MYRIHTNILEAWNCVNNIDIQDFNVQNAHKKLKCEDEELPSR